MNNSPLTTIFGGIMGVCIIVCGVILIIKNQPAMGALLIPAGLAACGVGAAAKDFNVTGGSKQSDLTLPPK